MAKDDPLFLQTVYAKECGAWLQLDLQSGKLLNGETLAPGEDVLLRCTCDNFDAAQSFLDSLGIKTVEAQSQARKIYHWSRLKLTKRQVFELSIADYEANCFSDSLLLFLEQTPQLFLKSLQKGFSVKTTSEKFLYDNRLKQFVLEKAAGKRSSILLSEFIPIKRDSLGKKETRHVVLDSRVVNSSRMIHTLMHSCLNSHIRKAKELAEIIDSCDFPKNYVLDLAEFEKGGSKYIDIVEINPISVSMCYLNNSIFLYAHSPEVERLNKECSMGFEYCYDYRVHPERYRSEHFVGEIFEYTDENRYCFIDE